MNGRGIALAPMLATTGATAVCNWCKEEKTVQKRIKGIRIDTSNHTLPYLCGTVALFRRLAADQGWSEQEVEKIINDAAKDRHGEEILAELAKYTDVSDQYPFAPAPLDAPIE